MYYVLNNVLNADEMSQLREIAYTAELADGSTSNPDKKAKKTRQVPTKSEPGKKAGGIMRKALMRHPRFQPISFPKVLLDPRLVRYEVGAFYNDHVDLPIFSTQPRIRTDLSCTLFISDPSEYEGGELVTHHGDRNTVIKGEAGSAVVYPSSSIHQIRPVTAGERIVGIAWVQSLFSDPAQREVLYTLEKLRRMMKKIDDEEHARAMALEAGHLRGMLMRMWADI